MAQAKTLTEKELKRVLATVGTQRHSARNATMLLLTHWAGMRVGEVAALKIKDVLADDGTIRNEVLLKAEQTKGHEARVVVLNEKLRNQIAHYLQYTYKTKDLVAVAYAAHPTKPLFYTQKSSGFSANSLTQYFFHLYNEAGFVNASSHSGRRTFITNLANKGVGVRVLMSLAGHKNISTTQHYIDVNDEMKRAAVELV
jgi:integrase/recombinase XerD